PYYGNEGNFATAGSSDFAYRNALETGQISYVTGENEYHRLFLGNSITAGDGTLTLAGAATRYAGPWKRDQDLAKTNALIKYFSESSEARWSITAALYDGIWDSTDQIPLRAVQNNQLDELGNVDPTVGGDSHRYSVSFHREQLLGPGRLQVNGYLVDYQLDLYSNFTYFVEDPVRGDQFQQVDDRWISGFNAAYARPLNIVGTPGELTVGIQLRRDDADVGLFKTERRQAFATVRDDGFTETTLGTFASIDQTWNDYFRTEASLRLDHYRFDIDSGLPANSGKTNDTLVSPKLNLIFSPWNHTETFLSYGRGFHSNDARGTVITVDPASGDLVDAVDPLAKARGIEAGFRTAALPNTQLSASIFSLELDSELVYVGDAGATEALGASERRGIEIGLIHSPVAWFIVDADVTFTRARFSRAGSDDHIPLSVDRTASLGLLLDDLNGISGGLRFRYLGDAPLIEDDSVRSDSTFLVNLEASYRINPSWSVHLDVLNLFDSDDRDITYLYESQLPGEAEPVNDIHFHPVEPRAFRIGISGTF
ncbi:MAG: TonB-dependent receptor, partial [Pseudohongiellaceae bacterium]